MRKRNPKSKDNDESNINYYDSDSDEEAREPRGGGDKEENVTEETTDDETWSSSIRIEVRKFYCPFFLVFQ